jgi:hypothetical protein
MSCTQLPANQHYLERGRVPYPAVAGSDEE